MYLTKKMGEIGESLQLVRNQLVSKDRQTTEHPSTAMVYLSQYFAVLFSFFFLMTA